MKKTLSFLFAILIALPLAFSQSFSDDFESYNVGDYLGNQGTGWTTWNGAPGTSEDIQIVNSDAFSGSNSIYYDSPYGGGPQDIVLPFGGVHNSGIFKFKSMWKIPKGNSAYFNFQGGANLGSSWAMDFYLNDDGSFNVDKLSGSFPQDQWFEIRIEINFDNNDWAVYVDNVYAGSFSSSVNAASYIDIFGVNYASSFWIDDVSYCVNNSCKPDVELKALALSPNPICTNHFTDVTLDLTNHGPDSAKGFLLALDMSGQGRITYSINLNNLAPGTDTSITISNLFKTNIVGIGMEVKAINIDHDRNLLNDTISALLQSYPSPSGSELVTGSVFQGVKGIGTEAQPDIVQVGKTNKYELTPPTGTTNADYGPKWVIKSLVATTTSGIVIPSIAYNSSYPSSSNASFSFKGTNQYLDSNITFTYTITNSPNGCDSSIKRTIRVVPTPQPNFIWPGAICLGDLTDFENKTSIHSGTSTYMWYFGDGDSSDNTNPIHEYKMAGSYNIRLVATSVPYNIVKDTTIGVTVNEIPIVKFHPNNRCEGTPVDFVNQTTVSSGALTYDWDFGDASTHGSATNPLHTYSAPGAYKVTLIASSNGCSATQTRNTYLFAVPVPDFVAPTTAVCAKTEIKLPNTSTIALGEQGALWNYNDGTISTAKDGIHNYANAGAYNVKLLAVSEFGCKDSITKVINIKSAPAPNFSGNQLCSQIPTVFTNKTVEVIPNPTYSWTFSDGYTSNQRELTRTWPIEGAYSVTLKANYTNGCSGTITKDVTVLPQPKADFRASDICSGETLNFVNLTTGDKGNIDFKWDFGNGISNEASPRRLFNPATTTTYTVSLAASYVNGCADTIFKNITVSQAPICDFAVKNQGYLKYSFTPSNSTYSKYEWYFGEGGGSNSVAPNYQFGYNGGFKVKMTATNLAGCECEITKLVSANSSVKNIADVVGLKIYPNPNNGAFTVSNNNGSAMKIEVYNLLGSKILSQVSNDDTSLINLGDVAKGIYLVKVTINEVTTTTKITVTN